MFKVIVFKSFYSGCISFFKVVSFYGRMSGNERDALLKKLDAGAADLPWLRVLKSADFLSQSEYMHPSGEEMFHKKLTAYARDQTEHRLDMYVQKEKIMTTQNDRERLKQWRTVHRWSRIIQEPHQCKMSCHRGGCRIERIPGATAELYGCLESGIVHQCDPSKPCPLQFKTYQGMYICVFSARELRSAEATLQTAVVGRTEHYIEPKEPLSEIKQRRLLINREAVPIREEWIDKHMSTFRQLKNEAMKKREQFKTHKMDLDLSLSASTSTLSVSLPDTPRSIFSLSSHTRSSSAPLTSKQPLPSESQSFMSPRMQALSGKITQDKASTADRRRRQSPSSLARFYRTQRTNSDRSLDSVASTDSYAEEATASNQHSPVPGTAKRAHKFKFRLVEEEYKTHILMWIRVFTDPVSVKRYNAGMKEMAQARLQREMEKLHQTQPPNAFPDHVSPVLNTISNDYGSVHVPFGVTKMINLWASQITAISSMIVELVTMYGTIGQLRSTSPSVFVLACLYFLKEGYMSHHIQHIPVCRVLRGLLPHLDLVDQFYTIGDSLSIPGTASGCATLANKTRQNIVTLLATAMERGVRFEKVLMHTYAPKETVLFDETESELFMNDLSPKQERASCIPEFDMTPYSALLNAASEL